MSVGFVLASEADFADARHIAAGFGLDPIGATAFGSRSAAITALQGASNVGIIISQAATRDAAFVALVLALSDSLRTAQLILAAPDARSAFPFLPETWPTMSLADANARATELSHRRDAPLEPEPPRAHPLPPNEHPAPAMPDPEQPEPGAPELGGDAEHDESGAENDFSLSEPSDAKPDRGEEREPDSIDTDTERAPPAPQYQPPPPAADPPAPVPMERARQPVGAGAHTSAPADATAFAPKKLRRGSPELVRVVIHQPDDLKAVIKAARQVDPHTAAALSGVRIGEVPIGASVGVSLEVRGAACDGALQRRIWTGEPLDFNFSVEPDADVKQAVILARVFVGDAQIGVLAFTRPVGGANNKPHAFGDRIRLKRHKRVFLSYSSKDRETVAAIATAYQAAGVEHFFDRTSLKSGEGWSPRLRREIDRADLFHLCWSKAASASEWVEKEAEHALTRQRRSNGKRPDITVQMLDGPPWAPHPAHLDSINFDDFVRAAIVGYARGDGRSVVNGK
ncbi:MAG: toll/interleukin-1 receptor domain-containing protein [Hyphomonadaceae bacterium]